MTLRLHTWMTKELGLQGTRLLAYAVVYAKTTDSSGVTAYDADLAEVTGLALRQLKSILYDLEKEELISAERRGKTITYTAAKCAKIAHLSMQKLHTYLCKNCTETAPKCAKIAQLAENTQEKAPHTPQKDIYINNLTPHSIRVAPLEISATVEAGAPQAEEIPTPVAPSPSGGYMRRPTVEEVRAYCEQRGNGIDAGHFVDHYTSNGWHVGRTPMEDWKAAVRTWERKASEYRRAGPQPAQQRRDRLEGIMDERAKFYEILNGKFDDNK